MESVIIFSKSFSRHEQRKFGYCASFGSFILALSSFYLLKPYFDPLPILNLPLSMGTGLPTTLVTVDRSSSQPSNITNSEPSNAGNFQQLHIDSSQALTTNISQQSNISSSDQPLSTSSSQQPNISSSSQEPLSTSSSQEPLSTSSSQQSNISSSDQPLSTSSSQQSNISSSSQEPLSMSSSQEPLSTSSSQQSNISSSSQEPLSMSSSQEPLSTSSSQQSNISSSDQPLSTSSSQQSNISSSHQPSNIDGDSQQSNISSSHQPLNTGSTSQPSVSDGDITLQVVERKPICNVSDPNFDYCDAEGDVRIHGISSRVFVVRSSQMDVLVGNDSWTAQPYPRKTDKNAMKSVKEFTVKAIGFGDHEEAPPACTLNHSVPAIIFSTGGYAGNHFHAFSDIIMPLFLASAQFQGEVQFLVTTIDLAWINKFQAILKLLSKYEIINIDIDETVHCFPRVIVGLKTYKDLTIDPLMTLGGHSMKELFKELLRKAYSLKRLTAIKIDNPTPTKPPRILILSRKGTRTFENVDEIAELAKSLGFEVVVSEATMNLEEFAQVVNSCDVMLGVHGAGLTNLVFLPTNAILIQVLPWGGYEWVATNFYGQPALDMDLRHLEYKIKEEESSLIQQYPLDDPVFRNPDSVSKHNWLLFKTTYMDKQNVKIDVDRFRPTLLEALELLHH